MGYCEIADLPLSPMVPVNDTGSQITTAMAQGAIESVTADIDSHLRNHNYALPICDPEALNFLTMVCANGAVAGIYKLAFPVDEGVGADKGAAKFYETRYQAQLVNIDKGFLGPDTAEDTDRLVNINGWAGEHRRERPWVCRDTRW
jgi:phage gp36-like protein